jgi:rod shape-determining protein MreC
MARGRRDDRQRWTITAIIIVMAVVLAFAGAFRFVPDFLGRPFAAVVGSVRGAGNALASRWVKPTCPAQERVDALLTENGKLRVLVAENEALKAALNYREQAGVAPLLARVLAETDNDVLHGFVIDRGEADGVAVGQPVQSGDGVLLGKVLERWEHTATVMLLTDSRSRLAVSLLGGSDTLGVLEGDRGLSLRVNLIPQTEALHEGDTVITSGLEPLVQRGLVVGVIESVERSTEDPFQSAIVTPFVQASHPTFVQVVTDVQKP